MEKQQLNNLVIAYQNEDADEVFSAIYAEVIGKQRGKLAAIGKSIRADLAEITALYEDVLMKCIEKYDGKSDFTNLFNCSVARKRATLYEKKKAIYQREVLEIDRDDEDAATFEVIDDFNLENHVTKKADQRQLIDLLLDGADELTTAIVTLKHANPEITDREIGRTLGFHHSKVSRIFNRLAASIKSKQPDLVQGYLAAL